MKVLNWGVLGSGTISNLFIRGLKHVEHANVLAIASRSKEKAQFFAKKHNIAKSYDRYDELIRDDEIDVVYIATPNSSHAKLCITCLENNKHVLCEKPFAISQKEAEKVFQLAKEKKLFCMEAMWSRFMPIMEHAKHLIEKRTIGDIVSLTGSFGKIRNYDPNDHVYNKDLGGGCLLDLGVYPISLALLFLGIPSESKGFLTYGDSGVDEHASVMLKFKGGEQAILTASFNCNLPNNLRIFGTKGAITIHEPMYRASKLSITKYSAEDTLWRKVLSKIREKYLKKTKKIPVKGNGYCYEAIEVINRINAGEIESPLMSWEHTLNVLRVIDNIREHSYIQTNQELRYKKFVTEYGKVSPCSPKN